MISVAFVSLAAALLQDGAFDEDKVDTFGPMVSRSPAMRRVFEILRRLARTDHTVLLTGESGVGKDLAARGIHDFSPRRGGPFVAINLAAIPETLFESELFGHVRGAFTSAERDRPGAFLEANGGTLFLDEVGDLSPFLQAKLLRALETSTIRAVGGSRTIPVDVRIVAATNVDLPAKVNAGIFRLDLFYRISTFPVEIPPLRERTQDIPDIARHLLSDLAPGVTFDRSAFMELEKHAWPGNVRELRAVLARSLLLLPHVEKVLRATHVRPMIPGTILPYQPSLPPVLATHHSVLQDTERKKIVEVLTVNNGHMTRSAIQLGISRSTLQFKVQKYAIRRSEYMPAHDRQRIVDALYTARGVQEDAAKELGVSIIRLRSLMRDLAIRPEEYLGQSDSR